MTATMTGPAANGRQQKTLSHQLDRLDAILDGLAEALNESVAAAVRDAVAAAVREAVEVALKEVLSRPELLRAALAAPGGPAAGAAEPATGKASPGRRLRRAWGRVSAWAWDATARVGRAIVGMRIGACQILRRFRSRAIELLCGGYRGAARVAARTATMALAGLAAAWRKRARLVAAAAVGTVSGALGSLADPTATAMAFGLTSAALTFRWPCPRPRVAATAPATAAA